MKNFIFVFFISIIICFSCSKPSTDKISRAFDELVEIKVKSYEEEYSFYYNPEVSTVFNQELDEFLEDNQNINYFSDGCDAGSIVLMQTRIAGNEYMVSFGICPEPEFCFQSIGNSEFEEFFICANKIYVPGNNFIYSEGIVNECFDKRKKFTLINNKISEVKQPYYYVGLKSKTLRPLKLYEDKGLKKLVASLPKNYEVEVLINDPELYDVYLVRTNFGLVGWTKLEAGQYQSIDIEGIEYRGD